MINSTAYRIFATIILVYLVLTLSYRKTYDNLNHSYEQFKYSDQRDQGEIQTTAHDDHIEIESIIKENKYSSFHRSITVYKEGKIEETEWSSKLRFRTWRVIYQNGLREEYSIHNDSGFGIRKVTYPDGQQFTNEVYGCRWRCERGWNAIGEETYAIQNKSIPYLLGDNEIKQYKFVTEDGSFDIIDLRGNHDKKILSSSSSSSSQESSDNDLDYLE